VNDNGDKKEKRKSVWEKISESLVPNKDDENKKDGLEKKE
jgi:hypothetical protein